MRFLFVVLCFLFLPSVAFAGGQNCNDLRSSADVMGCLSTQNEQVQDQLNEIFDIVSQQSQADDLAVLKEVQAQWLVYRDMECAHQTGVFETQSLQRLENLRCLNRLTQERIAALKQVIKNEALGFMTGEVSDAPRWMNALAQDYPNVYWRYGERISGDFNCDDADEQIMTGVEMNSEVGGPEMVVAISDNPVMGLPKSQLLKLSLHSFAVCGAQIKIDQVSLDIVMDGVDDQVDSEDGRQCDVALKVSAEECGVEYIAWDGEKYSLQGQQQIMAKK